MQIVQKKTAKAAVSLNLAVIFSVDLDVDSTRYPSPYFTRVAAPKNELRM
jgi:hypothetical protein